MKSSLRSRGNPFSLPYLPIWLAPLILLAPVYLTGRAIFWGTPLLQFAPWWSYAWQTLLAGHLPLWNPLLGMGAPLLANYQSALLYPPNWIYLLLYGLGGTSLMAWSMAVLAGLHLAWAGAGMAGILRRLGLGVLAQAVSGLAFGLCGYLVARLGFLSITSTAAWLPWVLLFLTPRRGEKGAPRRVFLKLVACLAMLLLAGHAQTAWYALILAGLWAGFWACFPGGLSKDVTGKPSRSDRWAGLRRTGKNWLWLGLALLFAVGICAAQLVPTAEYLAQSQRSAAVDYEYALNYSFWPWHMITVAAPGFFGSPASGDYWGASTYWEDAIYVGLLPLALTIGALLGSLRRRTETEDPRRLLTWCLLGLIVLSLLLALGKNTPIFPWLYRHIPTFAMFQAPARWLVWCEFALALLAGLGVEGWRRPQGWGLYWTRMWTMGAFAITVGAGAAWYSMGEISPSFIRSSALMGLLGVGMGVLSQSAPPREGQDQTDIAVEPKQAERSSLRKRLFQFAPPTTRPRDPDKPYALGRWQWAVAIFIACDLLAAGWGLNPGGSPQLYASAPTAAQMRQLTQDGRVYLAKKQEDWLKYVRFLRFKSFYIKEDWQNLRAVLLPNTTMFDGIASTSNFDPLVPGRYADWDEMLEQADPAAHERMLGLMGVTVVESLQRKQPFGVQYKPFEGSWLRLVPCGRLAGDRVQARSLVIDGNLDFDREVILEGLRALPDDDCQVAAQLVEPVLAPNGALNPNRLDINLSLEAPAWLVISEVWYPGWRARVDGRQVALLRADYLFQAVRVPAGEHRIILEYKPLSFWAGATVSLLSLILVICVFVRRRHSVEDQNKSNEDAKEGDMSR